MLLTKTTLIRSVIFIQSTGYMQQTDGQTDSVARVNTNKNFEENYIP